MSYVDSTVASHHYFQDYHWHHGKPVGDVELPAAPEDSAYFKFISSSPGLRIERYGPRQEFLGICYDSAECVRAAHKVRWPNDADPAGAVFLDADGRVIRYEKYEFLSAGPHALVRADIFTADGRLIETHSPTHVDPDGQDIVVTDALGKLKVVLHHRDISRGEPYAISMEWAE